MTSRLGHRARRTFLQGGCVIVRRIQVAERLEKRIDVTQLIGFHDPSGNDVKQKGGPQAALGKESAHGIGYFNSINRSKRMMVAFYPRHADFVLAQ